jgi:hypothetical protein
MFAAFLQNKIREKNYFLNRKITKIFLVSVIFIVAFLGLNIGTAEASSWYNASWSYRTKITIDHTKVASSTGTVLSNFPILISTTTSALKYTDFTGGHVASSTGRDILFTSSDGTTALNYEIEKYASSTGELIAWVKIPSLATSTNTDIYMYYGNANASAPVASVATGVWDDGGSNYFSGVWHLPNGTTLSANDSTGNGNNGTLSSVPPTATSGQLDGAGIFVGATTYINMGNGASLRLPVFTLSAWIKAGTDVSDYRTIFDKTFGLTNRNYWLELDQNTGLLTLRFSIGGAKRYH